MKSFYKITQNNEWTCSAPPQGDCWTDYIPVFIANGFYRNRTDFNNQHVYSQFCTKYPKIDRYLNTQRLVRLRERILVDMDFERLMVSHHENVFVDYDKVKHRCSVQRGSFTRLSGDIAVYTDSDGVISYLRATESILDIASASRAAPGMGTAIRAEAARLCRWDELCPSHRPSLAA